MPVSQIKLKSSTGFLRGCLFSFFYKLLDIRYLILQNEKYQAVALAVISFLISDGDKEVLLFSEL